MWCATKRLYTRRFVMPNITIRLNYHEIHSLDGLTSWRESNFIRFSITRITMKKKDKKALVDKIALGMAIVLKESNEHAARKIRRHIMEAAKEVVKRFVRHLPDDESPEENSPKKLARRKGVKVAVGQLTGNNGVVAVKKKAVRKKAVKRIRRK